MRQAPISARLVLFLSAQWRVAVLRPGRAIPAFTGSVEKASEPELRLWMFENKGHW